MRSTLFARLAAACGIWLTLAISASACTCLKFLEPRDILKHNQIVFEGEFGEDFGEVKVTEVFKGQLPSVVKVRILLQKGAGDCGLPNFDLGRRLLIVSSSLTNLSLSICNTYPQASFARKDEAYAELIGGLRALRR